MKTNTHKETLRRKSQRFIAKHGLRPQLWNHVIRTEAGKVADVAISLASYIIKRYGVLDFSGDLLPIHYDEWAQELGYTKRQLQSAMALLRKYGLMHQYILTERYKKPKKLKNGEQIEEYGFVTHTWVEPNTNKLSRAAKGKLAKGKTPNYVRWVENYHLDLKTTKHQVTPAHKKMCANTFNINNLSTVNGTKNGKLLKTLTAPCGRTATGQKSPLNPKGQLGQKSNLTYESPVAVAQRLAQERVGEGLRVPSGGTNAIDLVSNKMPVSDVKKNAFDSYNSTTPKHCTWDQVKTFFDILWEEYPTEGFEQFYNDQFRFSAPHIVPILDRIVSNGKDIEGFAQAVIRQMNNKNINIIQRACDETYEREVGPLSKYGKKHRRQKNISYWFRDARSYFESEADEYIYGFWGSPNKVQETEEEQLGFWDR